MTELEAPIFSSSLVISKSSPNKPKNMPATIPAPTTQTSKNNTIIILIANISFGCRFENLFFFSFLFFLPFLPSTGLSALRVLGLSPVLLLLALVVSLSRFASAVLVFLFFVFPATGLFLPALLLFPALLLLGLVSFLLLLLFFPLLLGILLPPCQS